MAGSARVVVSVRRTVLTLLVLSVGALGAAGCGGDGDGDESDRRDPSDVPSPVDDASTAAPAGERDDEAGEADEAGNAEAVELSEVRWYTAEDQFGDVLMRFFGIVENTSDVVQEVRVEVEAVDADGDVIGRSGPQPFLDTIMPGERLPISLGGRVTGEPADLVPLVRTDAVSEQRQDRYGIVTFGGEVLDFTVGEDEITVDVEVTNTGSEPSLIGVYMAAFDAGDEIVAAGVDFVTEMQPGETERLALEFSRDPLVDISVDRVEIYFPARAFHGLGE